MEKDFRKQARQQFIEYFKTTPEDAGFPCIDIYRKQKAFIYGKTPEALKAYKTSQNILRFMLFQFLITFMIVITCWFYSVFIMVGNFEWTNLLFLGTSIFLIFWGIILFGILAYIALKNDRKQKGKVIFLNY